MSGVSVILRKKRVFNTWFMLAMISLSMTHSIRSFDIDTALFNGSVKAAKGSFHIIIKTIVSSPKMVALILSIYFYKEILGFVKDVVGHAVGEFPKLSFAAGLFALLYASTYYT